MHPLEIVNQLEAVVRTIEVIDLRYAYSARLKRLAQWINFKFGGLTVVFGIVSFLLLPPCRSY